VGANPPDTPDGLDELVDAFNDLDLLLDDMANGSTTSTQGTGRAGSGRALIARSSARTLMNGLREAFTHGTPAANGTTLWSGTVGIELTSNGRLTLDRDVAAANTAEAFEAATVGTATDPGFLTRLDTTLDRLEGSGGLLGVERTTAQSEIDRSVVTREREQVRIERRRAAHDQELTQLQDFLDRMNAVMAELGTLFGF
jgi:flagellar capping protein FliD